jgi:hypothetical protein
MRIVLNHDFNKIYNISKIFFNLANLVKIMRSLRTGDKQPASRGR